MSTEQTTIADVLSEDQEQLETETSDEAARYRALASEDVRSPSTPDDAGCCMRCGEDLERHFASEHDRREVLRVFADEHDRVPACPVCSGQDETGSVSAAVKDAASRHEQIRQISVDERYRRNGWSP